MPVCRQHVGWVNKIPATKYEKTDGTCQNAGKITFLRAATIGDHSSVDTVWHSTLAVNSCWLQSVRSFRPVDSQLTDDPLADVQSDLLNPICFRPPGNLRLRVLVAAATRFAGLVSSLGCLLANRASDCRLFITGDGTSHIFNVVPDSAKCVEHSEVSDTHLR